VEKTKLPIFFIIVFTLLNFTNLTKASGYLSKPLSISTEYSWFDHTSPKYGANPDQYINIMTRYDGQVFTDGSCIPYESCYDGHEGIDFVAQEGTPVFASESGNISIGYSNLGGRWTKIWHASQNQATYYGHLKEYVITSGYVSKGDLIAFSGKTGVVSGPHLHFGVYTAQSNGIPIDPYGWSGPSQDPWQYDLGYLWDDNTPPSWGEEHVSGNITQDTTWISGNTYVVDGSITVNAGVTLTINPNVVVKFAPSNGVISVYGTLNANGNGFQKIYFTSIKDDSVGGDTNHDGSATAPAPGDYEGIYFTDGSSGGFSNSVFRYGGKLNYWAQIPYGAMRIYGGDVSVSNTEFKSNIYGIYYYNNNTSGTLSIQNSQFDENGDYGFYANSPNGRTLIVEDSIFGNHNISAGKISEKINFINSGNHPMSGVSTVFHIMYGNAPVNQTWNPGIPFLIESYTIDQGRKVTINPGTIVKFSQDSSINVYGSLLALGEANNRVYLTSAKDDSVGGDTNHDGSITSPAAGDYYGMYFYEGSVSALQNTSIKYGGKFNYWSPIPYGVIRIYGGHLVIQQSEINSNNHGIYQVGDTTLYTESSMIQNNIGHGLYILNSTGIATTTILNNAFNNNENSDAYISGKTIFVNSGNTGDDSSKFIISGQISYDQVWNPGIPFVLSYVSIDQNKKLTINPGTIVKFNQSSAINVYGSLFALGEANNKVYFTSIKDDTVGGDTNGDGSATSPAPSDYQGIYFFDGSHGDINYANISYGGEYNYWSIHYGALRIANSEVSVNNSLFKKNSYGIYMSYSGSVSVNRSEFESNDCGACIYATPATVSFTNNEFNNQKTYDILLSGNINFINSGNTGINTKGILLSNFTPTENQILNPGVPYVVQYVLISSGKQIDIKPNTILKFDGNGAIITYGNLNIKGLQNGPVYLTSLKDDSLGGDTNGDKLGTSPREGDYQGIFFYSGATGMIENAVIKYGGKYIYGVSPPYGVIRVYDGTLTIRKSTITKNKYGIMQQGNNSHTTISLSSITDNLDYGFYSYRPNTVNADHNWWGSATGPYNPNSNPNGQGDRVSDDIQYTPWLTSNPN